MKLTITIGHEQGLVRAKEFVLFGARHNFLASNCGNDSTLIILKTEFDDDYKKIVGLPDDYEVPDWRGYSCFLMDCVKFDFRINRINGKPLLKANKETNPFTFEEIPFNKFNPYFEEYRIPLEEDWKETKFEIELYVARK